MAKKHPEDDPTRPVEDLAEPETALLQEAPAEPVPALVTREDLIDAVRDLLLGDPTILHEALTSLGFVAGALEETSPAPVAAPLITLAPPRPVGQIEVKGEQVEIEVAQKRRVRCVKSQRFCRAGERAWVGRADLLADPAMGIPCEDPDALRLPPPAE